MSEKAMKTDGALYRVRELSKRIEAESESIKNEYEELLFIRKLFAKITSSTLFISRGFVKDKYNIGCWDVSKLKNLGIPSVFTIEDIFMNPSDELGRRGAYFYILLGHPNISNEIKKRFVYLTFKIVKEYTNALGDDRKDLMDIIRKYDAACKNKPRKRYSPWTCFRGFRNTSTNDVNTRYYSEQMYNAIMRCGIGSRTIREIGYQAFMQLWDEYPRICPDLEKFNQL